jgi:hypothetical protein
MDLDPCKSAAQLGKETRWQNQSFAPQPVRGTMQRNGVESG